jgi:hypothetical protein
LASGLCESRGRSIYFSGRIFAQKTIGFAFSGEKLLIGFPFSGFPQFWKTETAFSPKKSSSSSRDFGGNGVSRRRGPKRKKIGPGSAETSRARARAPASERSCVHLGAKAAAAEAAAFARKSGKFSAKISDSFSSHDLSLTHSDPPPRAHNGGSTRPLLPYCLQSTLLPDNYLDN